MSTSQSTRPAAAWREAVLAVALILAPVGQWHGARASDAGLTSGWVKDQASRVRLLAGVADGSGGQRQVWAGLEIELDPGWKTYWRHPGTSGVPPRVEWTGSDNLSDAQLLFPAPKRLREADGDTIGYKSRVLLPVLLKARDPDQPMRVKVLLDYGVCQDVCIPAQAELSLTIPPAANAPAAGQALAEALDSVPRAGASRRPTDPSIKLMTVRLEGAAPLIHLDVHFPGGSEGTDLFLEAPDGLWIPLPERSLEALALGDARFVVDLLSADLADLRGRMIRVTAVGKQGAAEFEFKLTEQ